MNRRGLAAGGHIQDSVSVEGLDHWGSEACWVGIAVAAENALTDSQRAEADKANSNVEILSWKWTRRGDGPAGGIQSTSLHLCLIGFAFEPHRL